MTQNKDALKISLIAILCGILLGVVILVLSGENPIALFSTLLKGIIGIDMMSGRSEEHTSELQSQR